MKLFKKITLILVVVFFAACDKHEVEYMATPVSNMAEFQLHNFVPEYVADSNNIYQVEINGQLYANDMNPLKTYNAIPAGSVGKYFATNVGATNIKLYKVVYEKGKVTYVYENGKVTDKLALKLVYDQTYNLTQGKQNVFIHDYSKPPVVFDNGYPYVANVVEEADSTAWVKFYNFLYEKAGIPTTLKLQYQYQYTNAAKVKSDWLNVGAPVSFGEATGWVPLKVIKTVNNSQGSARLDYRIKVIDAAGTDTGELQVINTKNAFVNYTDYWTLTIGRRYLHTLSGMRAEKPNAAVRNFTAL